MCPGEDRPPLFVDPRRLLRGSAGLLFAALGATYASGYLFHVVLTRLLGPDDYGALSSLLGFLLLMAVPTAGVQVMVARQTAALAEAGVSEILRAAVQAAGKAGLLFAVVLAMTAPWSARFLHIPVDVTLLVAAFAMPAFLGAVGRGALQGRTRFLALAVALFATAILRLALGTLLVVAGMGLRGAVLGILLAEGAGVGLVMVPLRFGRTNGRPDEVPGLLGEGVHATGTLLAFWLLGSLDILLVRHHFPAAAAGGYAAGALAGKAVLFVAVGITMIVFPRFAEGPGRPETRELLKRCVSAVIGLGVTVSVVIAAFPALLALVVGGDLRPPRMAAALLCLGMTGLGVVCLLVHYRLAMRRPTWGLWVAVGFEAVGITAFHSDGSVVAGIVLMTTLATAVVLSLRASGRATDAAPPEGELWEDDSWIDLSVVTPTYNGAAALPSSLGRLLSALDLAGVRHEVILVSDGSTDGSVEAARSYEPQGVHVLHYEQNQGKGYALRTGLARSSGRYVAFIDSDGELDPSDLVSFLTLMRMYRADIVVGSKRHPLSDVSYPWARRAMSIGYQKIVRFLFGIRVTDTQTGIKLVRREALAEVLPLLVEKRYAFDLELIVALRKAGHRRMLEAPVTLRHRFSSTISGRAVIGVARDTLAVWYRCYVLRRYDRVGAYPNAVTLADGKSPVARTLAGS